MREMYSDNTPITRLQAIFEGAKSFGLSEEDAWRTLDEVLLEVGPDATVSEYLDELTGAMARGILSTARQTAPKQRPSVPEEPRVASEEVL
jgi:hypothetical protein